MTVPSEVVGYIASGLVLLTFMTKRMRPLRILAILSNFAFIGYGVLDDIAPVLSLHLILLPMNLFRLWQLERDLRYTTNKAKLFSERSLKPRIVGDGVIVHAIEPLQHGRWEVALGIPDSRQIVRLAVDVRHLPTNIDARDADAA